jgi:5-methylcytosine-specific restriction endonuclease McrA
MNRHEEIEAAWAIHDRMRYGLPIVRTPETLCRLAEAQNWRCCYCGTHLTETGSSEARATFEHIVPRKLGGEDVEDNIVVACAACNNRRGHAWWPVHTEATGLTYAFFAYPEPHWDIVWRRRG